MHLARRVPLLSRLPLTFVISDLLLYNQVIAAIIPCNSFFPSLSATRKRLHQPQQQPPVFTLYRIRSYRLLAAHGDPMRPSL